MKEIVYPVTLENLGIAAAIYLTFLLALFLGSIVLPGIQAAGFTQPKGGRKDYKLSGLLLFLLSTVLVLGGRFFFGLSLIPVLQYFWSLLIVANLVSIVWATQLFISGRRSESYEPMESSLIPRSIFEFWVGPTLNPTLFGVDMKMFAYHPSLIGTGIVVAAFADAQYAIQGSLTPQMILFQLFWWVYLFTHYVREDFMLSTWDIIAEHFGFMLAWGDLVYVTFFYPIAGWFLLHQTEATPLWALGLLTVFHVLGHWIFRTANWQKDRYKRNPEAEIWGKPAETIGGRLLVSGWWGVGRKINYTGEIMVYFSFALCAGFDSWIPYILPLSLVVLLFQRAGRDDRKCRAKYGELWEEYCRKARFRIVPFVY